MGFPTLNTKEYAWEAGLKIWICRIEGMNEVHLTKCAAENKEPSDLIQGWKADPGWTDKLKVELG
jgi:hypothetical protein